MPRFSTQTFMPGAQRMRLLPVRRPPLVRVTAEVVEDLTSSVGALPAETGAMLGCDRDGVIRHVRFDSTSSTTGSTYSPDVATMSRVLNETWRPAGIELAGFAHSHPGGFQPSGGDLLYAQRILDAIPRLARLILPIVQTEPDTGRAVVHWYVAERSANDAVISRASVRTDRCRGSRPLGWFRESPFDRVRTAYSLPLLARCRLIVVGAGGSAAWVESMVRSGVGEITLIDHDDVSLTNLATQQVYRSDVGRPKVLALAQRLRDINPDVEVVTLVRSLAEVSDRRFTRLARQQRPGRPVPEVVLVCALTDDFWTQARLNRLALNLGLPMLAAQVYPEGRGAEVSFMVPGITPACGRCVLGGRYRQWLTGAHTTPGRSHGTPLAATDRLNALKGWVTMAILHGAAGPAWAADPAGDRWRELLSRIAHRNLAQIRLDPDVGDQLGLHVFDRVFADADRNRIVFDETVWLPQLPENPESGFEPCADCGGTGDLLDAIGTLASTELPRRAIGSGVCK